MASEGIRLVVAYDGSDFAGFATQPGQRTVQETLAEAIARLNEGPVEVRGASRTDAGVHATGQVVAFDADKPIQPRGWMRGLNGELPEDMVVRKAEVVAVGYDPRHDASGKHYRYLVELGACRDPLLRRRAWYLHPGMTPPERRGPGVAEWLDLPAMAEAAAVLEGRHDFRAFQPVADDPEHAVRTLTSLTITPGWCHEADLLAIDVRGTAFLRNMVRILVGTLVEVGRGRMTPDGVASLLGEGGRREAAGPTAPGHGLTLVEVSLGRSARPPGEEAR